MSQVSLSWVGEKPVAAQHAVITRSLTNSDGAGQWSWVGVFIPTWFEATQKQGGKPLTRHGCIGSRFSPQDMNRETGDGHHDTTRAQAF